MEEKMYKMIVRTYLEETKTILRDIQEVNPILKYTIYDGVTDIALRNLIVKANIYTHLRNCERQKRIQYWVFNQKTIEENKKFLQSLKRILDIRPRELANFDIKFMFLQLSLGVLVLVIFISFIYLLLTAEKIKENEKSDEKTKKNEKSDERWDWFEIFVRMNS
jgi:hypothetical protein